MGDEVLLRETATGNHALNDEALTNYENAIDPIRYSFYEVVVRDVLSGSLSSYDLIRATNTPEPPAQWKANSSNWVNPYEELITCNTRLNSGEWALLVSKEHKRFCMGNNTVGGNSNCLGMANGKHSYYPINQAISGRESQFLADAGLSGENYNELVRSGRIERFSLEDYFMRKGSSFFQAIPVSSEGNADYALYGNVSENGATISHIAYRPKNDLMQWVSKPSHILPALLHTNVGQLESSEMGECLRFYRRTSGSIDHTIIQPKL